MDKLSVKALAVGVGAAWAFCMLFAGWVAGFGWGEEFVEMISSIYIGYKPTFLGGIVGGIWGFVDGAIGGAIIALAYNAVAKGKSILSAAGGDQPGGAAP